MARVSRRYGVSKSMAIDAEKKDSDKGIFGGIKEKFAKNVADQRTGE